LNAELRNIEGTLSSEREMHVNELKKLTALLSEKVLTYQRILSYINL
jgi:homeobox protein cut-like